MFPIFPSGTFFASFFSKRRVSAVHKTIPNTYSRSCLKKFNKNPFASVLTYTARCVKIFRQNNVGGRKDGNGFIVWKIQPHKSPFLPFFLNPFCRRHQRFYSRFSAFLRKRFSFFAPIGLLFASIYTIHIFFRSLRLYELPFFYFLSFIYCINVQKVLLYMHNNAFICKFVNNYPAF